MLGGDVDLGLLVQLGAEGGDEGGQLPDYVGLCILSKAGQLDNQV